MTTAATTEKWTNMMSIFMLIVIKVKLIVVQALNWLWNNKPSFYSLRTGSRPNQRKS